MNNISAIDNSRDCLAMGYFYDVTSEDPESIEALRKEVFKNTSQYKEQMKLLGKIFYETVDIKPLQNLHD